MVSPPDFGEPRLTTGYELCVFDDATSATPGVVASATIPAGTVCGSYLCWDMNGHGFRYRDRSRLHDGVETLTLRGGSPGKGKIALRSEGAGVGVSSPLAATAPVRVQLRRTDADICWEATYSSPVRSGTAGFKARSD